MNKSYNSSCYHQGNTHRTVHDGHKMQGLADGYIVIIGHGNQQDDFSSCEKILSKKLSHAAIEGYAASLRDQVIDHFGCYGRRVETIYDGQVGQKKVHGSSQGRADEDVTEMSVLPASVIK